MESPQKNVKTAWISSLSASGVLPANKFRIMPPPTPVKRGS